MVLSVPMEKAFAATVLIVDDRPENLAVLGEILQDSYQVLVAKSGQRAYQLAASSPETDLILLDVMMPDMDGYAVLARLKENPATRDIPVIFVTAMDASEDEQRGLDMGAADYITKPLRPSIVLARVRTQLEAKRARDWLRDQNAFLEAEVAQRVAENQRIDQERLQNLEKLQLTLVETIEAIALALEKRDPYTSGHQHRVSELAVAIASEMGLSPEKIEGLRLGGLIHDIGKIYVPAEILSWPGRVSDLQMELIRTHPEVGHEIVQGIKFFWPIAEMVLQHHERLDGSGYPRGLKGDEILLEAKILAVADVVEAISSHRPYRPALGIDVALEEISSHGGLLYDPDAVDACMKLFREKAYTFSS